MNTLRRWLLRLGEFFGRARRERDLAAEMESHLQLHIDENLRVGMSAEEARRQALIKLGGLEQTKEMVRERRGLPMLEVLLQDLRFGVRMLRKNPGFTSVAVLTLALGIAANTAIFTAFDALVLRPRPVKDPDSLAGIWENATADFLIPTTSTIATIASPSPTFRCSPSAWPSLLPTCLPLVRRPRPASLGPLASSSRNCFRAALNPSCVFLSPATTSQCWEPLLS